jgi:beta-phosphoglucomutase
MEFIYELKKKKIRIALASASRNTPMILERVGMNKDFDAVADGNTVEKTKPDPEVFLKAAAMLGVENARCVVFEDAVAGVEAALSAGMVCIGIGNKNVLQNAHMVIRGLYEMDINKLIVLEKRLGYEEFV